jgi:hypothetical protein
VVSDGWNHDSNLEEEDSPETLFNGSVIIIDELRKQWINMTVQVTGLQQNIQDLQQQSAGTQTLLNQST